MKTDDIDASTIKIDDIDPADHPEYTDAYISYAETKNGRPLEDWELEQINDNQSFVIEQVYRHIY